MQRLFAAICRLPDFGGDTWAKGIEVIQRKYGVVIWLSKFQPTEMQAGESPKTTITIEHNWCEKV